MRERERGGEREKGRERERERERERKNLSASCHDCVDVECSENPGQFHL